ncbi:MAG: RNA polymerase sigma factor [Maricaulis sp.]|nr:RNA polymerase sigma factor [Maricaulis sp.]
MSMAEQGRAGLRTPDIVKDDTDEALMMRIAKGDRIAARTLMGRCLPRVVGMANRMLNDAVEAEDIAQETFIRVWNASGRWEPGRAKVSTWIGRIAINLCYDRMRKRREVLTDTPPDRPDISADQEAELSRSQTAQKIRAALVNLPDRQKRALELVHFQEMSNIEAAEIMSVSVDALESLLSRGRRKLKALLVKDAGELMASYGQATSLNEGITS